MPPEASGSRVTHADRRQKEYHHEPRPDHHAIFGGLNSALSWLLWVALIVGVIALIVFLFRVISGSRRT